MSDKLRDQVEDRHAHQEIETARNLPDAANSGQSLEGYAAINGLHEDSEIASMAQEFFRRRQASGEKGSADGDWFQAIEEVRRRQDGTGK